MLDLRLAGLRHSVNSPPPAIHAGLHVLLENGKEYVLEQLFGTIRENFVDGLNWTPLETFRVRDRGGWDVSIPATAFRGITDELVEQTLEFINHIPQRPFFGEDCTMLIERAFQGRRLFGDSPFAQRLGLGLRVGDPALPLLRRDAKLDEKATKLLRADVVSRLPDPTEAWNAPNARLRVRRALFSLLLAGICVGLIRYSDRHGVRQGRSVPLLRRFT
ncbi:MAG: hypothetical protein JO076_05195, partial [Verrucomicrobia bacterium]|nr:hypothetical protein [Verrucomicrobiota bacterium]